MGLIDQLTATAMLGRGELRRVYQDRKRKIEAKAKAKRAQAKGRIAAAKIKAEEAKELADLEAAMYQAQINAQNAQKRAKELRHQAGVYTPGEHVGRLAGDVYKVGKSFVGGLMTEPKKQRRTTRRRK